MIGADAVIYQDLDALRAAVRQANPALRHFETSCFDGNYITGDVTSEYLAAVETRRDDKRQEAPDDVRRRLGRHQPGRLTGACARGLTAARRPGKVPVSADLKHSLRAPAVLERGRATNKFG